MDFQCKKTSGKRTECWIGSIKNLKKFGSHYEIWIESRSSIFVMFGKTSRGYFACMPDFDAGCHLTDFQDFFWNTERLSKVLGKVDGITVATALKMLSDTKALA